MSGTFCKYDQGIFTKLFGRSPDRVMWLELSQRGIRFGVIILGNPISAITSSSKQDYKHKMEMQTIIYKFQAAGCWDYCTSNGVGS